MSQERKQHSVEFTANVALAALKETETSAELAARYRLHPTQINQWKHQALENLNTVFEGDGDDTRGERAQSVVKLYR
ncbi:MAG: hypothetical protein H0V62_07435 [Gammaproteobacteria bacterium]|nr:hypothetical protein [Gammaproteobacteria bacterium]